MNLIKRSMTADVCVIARSVKIHRQKRSKSANSAAWVQHDKFVCMRHNWARFAEVALESTIWRRRVLLFFSLSRVRGVSSGIYVHSFSKVDSARCCVWVSVLHLLKKREKKVIIWRDRETKETPCKCCCRLIVISIERFMHESVI